MDNKYVALIVTPQSLHNILYDYFHSSPSSDHMGTYNILFQLCMRFMLAHMREDISSWVTKCDHFISQNV